MDTWFSSQTGEKGRDSGTWLTFGLWKLTQSNTACEHQAKPEWPRLPIPVLPSLFWKASGTVPLKGRPKQAEEQKGHSVHLLGTLDCAFSSTGKMDKSILSICFVDNKHISQMSPCSLPRRGRLPPSLPEAFTCVETYHIYPPILRSTQFPPFTCFFASLDLRLFTVGPQKWATKLLYKLKAPVLLWGNVPAFWVMVRNQDLEICL